VAEVRTEDGRQRTDGEWSVQIASGKKLSFIYSNFIWEIADGDN
jgi:hypothetical protein